MTNPTELFKSYSVDHTEHQKQNLKYKLQAIVRKLEAETNPEKLQGKFEGDEAAWNAYLNDLQSEVDAARAEYENFETGFIIIETTLTGSYKRQ